MRRGMVREVSGKIGMRPAAEIASERAKLKAYDDAAAALLDLLGPSWTTSTMANHFRSMRAHIEALESLRSADQVRVCESPSRPNAAEPAATVLDDETPEGWVAMVRIAASVARKFNYDRESRLLDSIADGCEDEPPARVEPERHAVLELADTLAGQDSAVLLALVQVNASALAVQLAPLDAGGPAWLAKSTLTRVAAACIALGRKLGGAS